MFAGASDAFEASLSPHYNAGDGTYSTTTRDGRQVWIPDKYLYFSAPGFPTPVQSAYLEITYYDEQVGPRLVVEYDSTTDKYYDSSYHTRSSGEGTMVFVKSYQRLDDPLFANRENGSSDFRINAAGLPIQSVIVRDTPFSDPYAAYALSHNPPWLSPYTGPSRDDVNANTIKGKVVAGYQGWFKTPNDLYDRGFGHWDSSEGHLTVDMWPDPADYEPSSLHLFPGVITEGGEQGYLFSSADPAVVQKHFKWMRQYNIDGVYLQRFFTNSNAGAKPEWVLALVREAAHLHGRVWAIEYDLSGGDDSNIYDNITADWKWLVDEVGITSDSRYLHEQGKPVVVLWGAAIRDGITQASLDPLVDFFKNDPIYGGNYVVGCVKNSFPSGWEDHFAKYDSIFAWMGSQTNVANFANSHGINAQVHVWPGFSWHNLKRYEFPTSYTDRGSGSFLWGKISNGINIIDPETVFVGMFDEYDEGTAIMPMSDDPPVITGDIGHYITNTNYYTGHTVPSDWWMTLSGYAKEMLCDQVPFSFTMPTESSLDNRSNIGPELTVDLGGADVSDLLYWLENTGDGTTVDDVIAGVTCRRATDLYMYFDIDDAVLNQISAGVDVTIVVDYYDAAGGVNIGLHYDSVSNQWKTHPKSFTTSGSNHWRTARFEIDDAYFGNRENGADFRLRSNTVYNMNIARVRLILEESSAYVATIPDVIGQTRATAESNIVAAGLVVATVTTAYSSSVPAGVVLSQSPTGDTVAAIGSSVDLVVSTNTVCAGLADFDCNGVVDVYDFSYMAGVWLTDDPAADIAQPADGVVDVLDLSILAQEWLSDSLTDGAVAYWKLDETAGAVASDYSVNAYDGTLMNMDESDWVAGVSGNALSFDGVNDYVQVAGFKGVTGSASRTCMAWVNTSVGGDILGYGNNVGIGTKWRFRILSTGTLVVQVGGYAQTTSATVNDGNWHHVAVVIPDKPTPLIDDIELFIDGNKITDITTAAGTEPINTGADNTVKIGVYEYVGTGLDYFDGRIDDVRIYDRALSEAEIARLAQ